LRSRRPHDPEAPEAGAPHGEGSRSSPGGVPRPQRRPRELAECRGWDNEREKRLVRALEEDEARLKEEAIATFRAWREAVDAFWA
jgi:hypothetical protein